MYSGIGVQEGSVVQGAEEHSAVLDLVVVVQRLEPEKLLLVKRFAATVD